MKQIIVAIVGSESRPATDKQLREVEERIEEGIGRGRIVVPYPCELYVLDVSEYTSKAVAVNSPSEIGDEEYWDVVKRDKPTLKATDLAKRMLEL